MTTATTAAGEAAETIDVRRPVDGSPLGSIAVDSSERVAEVVARVRAAQPEWEAIGFDGRRRWLERLRDWILANQDRLDGLMQAESGKVRADAALESFYLLEAINFWCKQGPRFLADEQVKPHSRLLRARRAKIVHRPYPVAGIISPWNFPLILSLGDGIPGLVAGCALVIKPSELTPLTLAELVRAWKEELGAPDVLDVVNGTGEAGGTLVDECDFIQFTGSERTGKIVMKRAAETLTPVSLELGGKDPMVVTRSAEIERAANAACFGGLVNTGQICLSIERVYVEAPVYDEFVERLRANVERLRQGADERGYEAELGAMTSPAQVEIVAEQVEDARRAGARILTGGRRGDGPGNWYEPTLIADADPSMKVMREETFGPVIAVMKAADADDAVRLANDTTYGLGAAVFAGDATEGELLARRIEAGTVAVNDLFVSNYAVLGLPMGGWKSSGIGYRHGAVGIRKFCRAESITTPRIRQPRNEFYWFPYGPRRSGLVRAIYRFRNAGGWRERLGLRR